MNLTFLEPPRVVSYEAVDALDGHEPSIEHLVLYGPDDAFVGGVIVQPARTPLSLGTLAAKSPVPQGLVPPFLQHRGFGLPAGTLFATARSP